MSLLGKLHRDVVAELRDDAYNGPKCFKNRIIGTFHAGLSSPDQKSIVENFTKTDSVIRFMICTIAFGLGVNIPDVRFVLHWGICDSALQYWQEVGRAGRDGKNASAYMYATKCSIVHVPDEMKSICYGIKNGTITCLRKAILNSMIPGSLANITEPCNSKCDLCECTKCLCCSLCMATCPCRIHEK